MPKLPKIAVIDDDVLVRNSLEHLIGESGFEAHCFESGHVFLETGSPDDFDLFLIDLRLSGESGLEIAQELLRRTDAPIMMFTGMGDEIDKIIGLEAGVDDYMLKPYNPRELIARIRALLRRQRKARSPVRQTAMTAAARIRFGRFTLDIIERTLTRDDGADIVLTNAEFRLLEYFARHPNRVVERAELLNHIGSDLSQYVDRTIDVLILRLRRKIEIAPAKPVHLQTRRGKGYVFVADAIQAAN